MTAIWKWLCGLLQRPDTTPFVPEEDAFIQRAHDATDASRERQQLRKHDRERWSDRNALERELLGRRET